MKAISFYKAALAAAVLPVITGCVVYPERDDFGQAVRHMQEVQSATAESKAAPQDGQRAQRVLQQYRADVAKPKEIKNEITINVGN